MIERCAECGFDGANWTDKSTLDAIAGLPERWTLAVQNVEPSATGRRLIAVRWSIAEYVDHVRETLFGMRFILDIALTRPGTDLGDPPDPTFAPVPKDVDIEAALTQLGDEANRLHDRLAGLTPDEWQASLRFGGESHDAHWICRHAIHDATHHLGDIEQLKAALSNGA